MNNVYLNSTGLYNTSGNSAGEPPDLQGTETTDGGVVLSKDPVMLLNEFCQRSQQKVKTVLIAG